jgi:hypothetical protein
LVKRDQLHQHLKSLRLKKVGRRNQRKHLPRNKTNQLKLQPRNPPPRKKKK